MSGDNGDLKIDCHCDERGTREEAIPMIEALKWRVEVGQILATPQGNCFVIPSRNDVFSHLAKVCVLTNAIIKWICGDTNSGIEEEGDSLKLGVWELLKIISGNGREYNENQ